MVTGLALIVAIGSQNAFVLRQGILRQYVPALVLFCVLADALLILGGIGGAGVLIRDNQTLMTLTRYGGALFLAGYAAIAARRAWAGSQMQVGQGAGNTLPAALAACFGFTCCSGPSPTSALTQAAGGLGLAPAPAVCCGSRRWVLAHAGWPRCSKPAGPGACSTA